MDLAKRGTIKRNERWKLRSWKRVRPDKQQFHVAFPANNRIDAAINTFLFEMPVETFRQRSFGRIFANSPSTRSVHSLFRRFSYLRPLRRMTDNERLSRRLTRNRAVKEKGRDGSERGERLRGKRDEG